MNKTSVTQQPKTASFLPPAQGLLQRKCACGNHTVAGGECAECAKKKTGLQRKLTIGASNDPLEQEADWVADQVMATSSHSAVSAAPPRIQRYAGQATEGLDTAPASIDRVLARSGSSLEPTLRQDMEQRFGHDFSQVRVHTDTTAEQSSRDVNANAYTVGNNVVFGAGQFAPGTHEGRRLLAHELTHVVQQLDSNGIRVGSTENKRSLLSAAPAYPIQRQKSDVVEFEPAKIIGQDPNVLHMPDDKLSAKGADFETQEVLRNIAAAHTRAIVFLERVKTEVMMAVDTFKSQAIVEIEGMDLDPSSAWELVPTILAAVGGTISAAFPPAGAVVITTSLVINASRAVVVGGVKEEASAFKLQAKASVNKLGEMIKNAQSSAIIKLNGRIPSQLNELAATDKGVWELLKVGSDNNLDTAVGMLGIRDPYQGSLYGDVLKVMMGAFGSWMGKAKFQLGMTGSDKLISENVVHSELHKGLRNAQRAGESESLEKARKIAKEHESGPMP